MKKYNFMTTAICPNKSYLIRDYYKCCLETDATVTFSEIAEICEKYVRQRLFQEILTENLKADLPPGRLVVKGNHFGQKLVTEACDLELKKDDEWRYENGTCRICGEPAVNQALYKTHEDLCPDCFVSERH